MSFPSTASGTRAPLIGVVLMLLAVLCFAVLDSSAKYLSQHYPVAMVVWARYAVHTLLMLIAYAPARGRTLLHTRRPGRQLLRALLLLSVTVLFVSGLRFLPLAEATAIIYLTPLLVTALSVPLLGERVARGTWIAILTGLAGVLIVVRPGGALLGWTVLLPLAAAFCNSLYQILTRSFAGSENGTTTNFITGLTGTVLASLTLPWVWTTPTAAHAGLMIVLGCAGFGGHALLIRAFEHASPAVLGPLTYGQLGIATLLGFSVFGTLPDAASFAGMALIVAGGLLVLLPRRAG